MSISYQNIYTADIFEVLNELSIIVDDLHSKIELRRQGQLIILSTTDTHLLQQIDERINEKIAFKESNHERILSSGYF